MIASQLMIKAVRPDSVVTLGDEADFTEIGRWSEGKPGWYEQTLAENRDLTVDVLWRLGDIIVDPNLSLSNFIEIFNKYLVYFRQYSECINIS